MAQSFETLSELSETISEQVKILTKQLTQNSLPQPSFHSDGPVTYPPLEDVQIARASLINAARSLLQLATGPAEFVMGSFLNPGVLQIFDAVPLEGSISYAELAAKIGLPGNRLYRFVRYARSMNIFYEPSPGHVAYTAFSAIAVKFPDTQSLIRMSFEQLSHVNPRIFESLEKYGDSQSVQESAAGLAYGVKEGQSLWDVWGELVEGENKGWLMRLFTECLEGSSKSPASAPGHANGILDWGKIGKGTVVDVGGNSGYISFEIAAKHPDLKFVVRDMPRVQESFEKARPPELKSRATYQIHSFFDPQPVKGADVYFLRCILHDWPDADAIKIARQLVPAMGLNSRIVLFENVMLEVEDGSNALMHLACGADMEMMAAFNSRERTKKDWIELMKRADERLTLKEFTTPAGSALTGLVFGLN